MSTSPWLFPAYGRQIAIELQKQQCDVIQVQHCSQYLPVIRAFNPRAKIVLHLHNRWFSQSNARTLASRLRHVDLVTTVSNFVTAAIRSDFGVVADRCETMYNGIDPTEFCRVKNYAIATQSKEKHILCVGAVSPHSGTHVLLDAFEIVLKQFQSVRLDIVGPLGNYPLQEVFDLKDRASFESLASFYAKDHVSRIKGRLSLAPKDIGPYMSDLKRRLSTNTGSKVTFTGAIGVRSELVRYYYKADVFAFPALCNHGFGLAPVESMAAGTPVVASRSGATIETIVDQKTGFLVEKNDSRALAEAILKLLENDSLRETMGRAARQRVLELFTWDRIAADMNTRYRTLCEGASSNRKSESESPVAAVHPG
jgi:glycosyltransferase involved in cell wall biosynthesis